MHTSILSTLPVLLLAKLVAAGCETHTFGTCEDNIVHWYDPNTGEICDLLDCGGGRAPVKYSVPGCAAYTGTEVRKTEPSYMPCFSKTAGVSKAASTLATVSSAHTTTEASTGSHQTSTAESSAESSTVSKSSSAQPTSTASGSSSSSAASSAASTADTTPSTTPAPTVSTSSAASSNESAAASTTSAPPNAGNLVRGSLAGVIAVAIGAVAFI